eukprot:CAMPEP_0183786970 /NCGR_PEP_ID=MMETSP0739-20130205/67300_1 /TAXON_ID=385413 /ORGANISM="Thalassiosira miniscula, Strain CCMP1093" /LENGTH=108 /DNA_ID=CAMNT_0026031037 /DNA_START=123 /DNA_END=449 /DNA_ORIENTATION=-
MPTQSNELVDASATATSRTTAGANNAPSNANAATGGNQNNGGWLQDLQRLLATAPQEFGAMMAALSGGAQPTAEQAATGQPQQQPGIATPVGQQRGVRIVTPADDLVT